MIGAATAQRRSAPIDGFYTVPGISLPAAAAAARARASVGEGDEPGLLPDEADERGRAEAAPALGRAVQLPSHLLSGPHK